MLVLHTAQLEDRPVLWGEDSAPRQDRLDTERHPSGAEIDLLSAAWGSCDELTEILAGAFSFADAPLR